MTKNMYLIAVTLNEEKKHFMWTHFGDSVYLKFHVDLMVKLLHWYICMSALFLPTASILL